MGAVYREWRGDLEEAPPLLHYTHTLHITHRTLWIIVALWA